MQEHEQRVIGELGQLEVKIGNLSTFIAGDFFKTLPAADRALLEAQYEQMSCYGNTLRCRIARFSKQEGK